MAKKYRLQLVKLTCTHKQDTVGRDDPKIVVDGKTVYGPGDIGRGETINLNRTALFTTSAQVQLIEVDAGNDDDMGTITVRGAAQLDQGDQVGEFHRTHADYALTYQVVAA